MKRGGAAKDRAIEKDVEHEAERKSGGGKVHKAHGHKTKERSDKRTRLKTGGKVATPKSPLTGAMPQGLPGGGKGENKPDKSND